MAIKYIFCITTGRSGSDYLYRIFDSMDNCVAQHEPEPKMNGIAMREFLSGNDQLLNKLMPAKIAAINNDLGSEEVYFESNHCFIKGFGYLLSEHISLENVGVIVLKRDKQAVVSSFTRIASTPITDGGRNWLISPNANTILEPPIGKFRYYLARQMTKVHYKYCKFRDKKFTIPWYLKRTSEKLLNWYYDETYERGKEFLNMHPNIKKVEVRLSDLNQREVFQDILNQFKLESRLKISQKTEELIGVASNLKLSGKVN